MSWQGRGQRQRRREFEAFVRTTGQPLMRTAYVLTWDMGKAEDLVQETYLRLARRWDRARSVEHQLAYARRVLVNLALGGSEKRARQHRELTGDDDFGGLADPSAARAFTAIEDIAEFRAALLQLPSRQRLVLVLRYFDDLPEREVAELLGCSVGTVSSTASRAVAQLARALWGAGAAGPEPLAPSPGASTSRRVLTCPPSLLQEGT